MSTPHLQATQDAFWAYISGTSDTPSAQLRAEAYDSVAAPAGERLAIYRNMYIWRLIAALRHDFPKLAALLGTERFAQLATDYIRTRPSQNPDIGRAGEAFATHLAGRALQGDAAYTVYSELAALEWARNTVFLAADALSVSANVLSTFPPNDVARVRLQAVPAFVLLRAGHDVAQLWGALDVAAEGAAPPPSTDLPACPCAWAVWRHNERIFHAALTSQEAAAVERLMAGATLADICEIFADVTDPIATAFQVIGSWFQDGWVLRAFLSS